MNTATSPQPLGARIPRKAPCLLYLVAALLLCGALWQYCAVQHRLDTWQRAEATIVALEKEDSAHTSKGGQRSSVYYPRFCFTAADNRSYTVRGKVGSNPAAYRCGEKVEALYPSEAPAEAQINTFTEQYFLCLLLTAFGLFTTIGGVVLQLRIKKLQHIPGGNCPRPSTNTTGKCRGKTHAAEFG